MYHAKFSQKISSASGEETGFVICAIFSNGRHLGDSIDSILQFYDPGHDPCDPGVRSSSM